MRTMFTRRDGLLIERHIAKAAHRKNENHMKRPVKRTKEDDLWFEERFRRIIEKSC